MKDDAELVTIEQAGKIIGIAYQTAYRHIAVGNIKAERIGRRVFVRIGEAKRFRDASRQPRRLRGKKDEFFALDDCAPLTLEQTARFVGISRTKLINEIHAGRLESIWVFGHVFVAFGKAKSYRDAMQQAKDAENAGLPLQREAQ